LSRCARTGSTEKSLRALQVRDRRFYLDGLRTPDDWTAVYDLDGVFDEPLLLDVQGGDVHFLAELRVEKISVRWNF